MNKRELGCLLLTIVISVTLSACSDRLDLENAATPLALGLDIDKKNKFRFYSINPVFSKNVKKKSQDITGEATSLRQSRSKQNAQSSGNIQGRNYQVILVGKKLLEYEDWFRMFDVIFRDSRNTITDRVIAVDGPVSEIMNLNLEDQPLLPILLRGMVDTNSSKSETVSTTAQELHRQFYEKGVTPYISLVKVINKKVILSGAALLTRKGTYATSLGTQETVLLNILQKKAKTGISLSFHMPGEEKKGPFATDILSFTAGRMATKIKTSFQNESFIFDIHIKTTVGLSEHLFPFDVYKDAAELEKKISEQTQKQFDNLIKKIQKHKIDPIGLGLYARAYEYTAFKQVEDHWGEALSKADIQVSVDIKIGSMGPVK